MATANKIPKLTEDQRAQASKVLKETKAKIKQAKAAFKALEEAVFDSQLSGNEEIAELESHFDTIRDLAQDIALDTTKDKVDLLLLAQLNKNNTKFSVGGVGTVSASKRKFWSCTDPDKLVAYAVETGDFGMFTSSVGEKWSNAYMAEHGKRPPGCDYWEKHTLTLTPERKKV